VDGTVEAPPTYPEGVGWLWETALLEALWNNRDDRPFRRELFSVGRRAGQVRAFAYLSLRDPLPFLMHAQWRSRAFLWTRARNLLRRCTPAGRAHGKPQPLME
jgi:hypothetical protein